MFFGCSLSIVFDGTVAVLQMVLVVAIGSEKGLLPRLPYKHCTRRWLCRADGVLFGNVSAVWTDVSPAVSLGLSMGRNWAGKESVATLHCLL